MTCIIPRPSPQALFDNYRNMFSANVLGGSPVVPESNEWYVVALNYAMAEEFYAISEQAWRERDPRYACCDNLLVLAEQDGVFPRPASYAQGFAIITGVAGTVLPARLDVVASNGRNYGTVGTIPLAVPASGSFIVQVQDTTPGTDGNAAGTAPTGTLATGVTGLNRDVVICGGSFCGGAGPEDCEAFRTRYLARKQYQPRATQAWARAKLLEWPCATRVIPRGGSCCNCSNGSDCNCKQCGNTLDFYVMFDNAFACGIAPDNILTDIQTWMFGETQGFGQGQMEIGVCGSIAMPIAFYVDVRIDIEGCPSVSQVAEIRSQVADFFKTVEPSQSLRARQIELLVANIVGPQVNVSVALDPVVPNDQQVFVSQCGDLEPECDYLPCLRNVTLTGPDAAVTGGTC